MNAIRSVSVDSTLPKLQRRLACALLLAGALVGAVLGSPAHAQITFRSAASAGHSAAPAPTFVNAGAVAAGTGAITPALPANIEVDDILLLFLETSNQAISIANQSGGTWTAVANSPQSTGTAAGADGVRLTVFWSRYNGTQTAPVTSDSGNHQLGRIIAVRGVYASGNPWDVTAGGVEAGNTDTSGSIPGATTTVANTLVVAAIATALPDSTTTTVFSGWANVGLAGLTERTDNSTANGNGGGLGIATGTRAATGAYGATTVTTSASTAKAMMSIALRPATAALTINTPAGTAANDVMIASVGFRVESPGQYSTDIDVTAPPGWTLVRRLDNLNSTGSGLAIFQRVAVAGEPASHTWFFSCQNVSGGDTCVTLGFNGAAGGIAGFIGVDNGTPIDAGEEDGVSSTVASTNLDTPSINTSMGNKMLVTSHAIANANTFQNPPPSGMTQAYQRTSGTIMLQASYALQAAAGATGTKRATDLGPDAADLGNAHILALRPARVINQSAYRFFDNADSTNVGSALAAQNTAATLASTGAAFRLRVLLHVGNSNLAISGQAFKLQFAARSGTCDTAFSGETYADVTAGSVIAYNNNATPADGAALTANAGDPTHGADTVVNQTYEELNNFTNSVAAINAGQDGKWDFALRDNGAAAGTSYCFRIVRDTGTVLETYSVIPEIITSAGVPAPGSFNAFETSTAAGAITGVIRTKVAGSAFSLDVVSISGGVQQAGFTDAVTVELLGNNTLGIALDAQNCPTSFTLVQTVSPNPTITAGRSTVNFAAVANSWRDVRVRVRWPTASPTVTWCSTDNFAIRPNTLASFAVSDADWQTAGTGRALTDVTFGAVTHKAGRPLSVRATAVNSVSATTGNYTGAPTATLTVCAGAACTASFGTLTLSTTFAAGQLTSDVASYDNVGSFALQLVDSTFASVDAADTTGDCSGRYVCSATINVGRFVPDHFAVALNSPVFGPACGSFSYIGQAFNYSTAPAITVTAQDFANNTTTLYNTAGSWWRITNASLTGKSYTAAVGALDVSGLPGTDPVIAPAGGGTGTLTFGSGTGIFFTRTTPTAPASPYDADLSLAINVIDADGVALATNPARFGTATSGNGIAFSDGNALTTNDKQMRFGRLAIRNANGSQLVPLLVQVEAQYWSGAPMNAFITNTQDNCTAIAAANDAMGNYTANLSGSPTCETAIGGGGTLSAGRRTLRLAAPGSGNNGSVDVTVNLGTSASGSTCTTQGGAPGAATTANLPHLQGNWTGGAYNVDPSARATFGVFRGAEEVVFVRENF